LVGLINTEGVERSCP